MRLRWTGLVLLAFGMLAQAQTRYVTDRTIVELRRGPSTEYLILRNLEAGERVEVLEQNEEQGYSRVRVADQGTEGWILTRFLTAEPIARERLAVAERNLASARERVATLVVHDANMGRTALDRGCVDLVVAGHTHVQIGPEQVLGENGRTGWTFTNGTTGGAAFAVAVGGKLRREAQFTFLTYADGVPVGLQPVKVSTNGVFTVDPYVDLGLDPEVSSPDTTD